VQLLEAALGGGVVGGTAQAGVGDEASAQAVGAVTGQVGVGRLNGVAHQRVQGFERSRRGAMTYCVKPASSLRQACVKPASSLRQDAVDR
jgi:hypothetical protein